MNHANRIISLFIACALLIGCSKKKKEGDQFSIFEQRFQDEPLFLLPVDHVAPTNTEAATEDAQSWTLWPASDASELELKAVKTPWIIPQSNLISGQELHGEQLKLSSAATKVHTNFLLEIIDVITCDDERATFKKVGNADQADLTVASSTGDQYFKILNCDKPKVKEEVRFDPGRLLNFALQDPNRYQRDLWAQTAGINLLSTLERSKKYIDTQLIFRSQFLLKKTVKPIDIYLNGNQISGIEVRRPSGKTIYDFAQYKGSNAFYMPSLVTTDKNFGEPLFFLGTDKEINRSNLAEQIKKNVFVSWLMPFVVAHEYGHYIFSDNRSASTNGHQHAVIKTDHHVSSLIKPQKGTLVDHFVAKAGQLVASTNEHQDQINIDHSLEKVSEKIKNFYQRSLHEALADLFANWSLGSDSSRVNEYFCPMMGPSRNINAPYLNSGSLKAWGLLSKQYLGSYHTKLQSSIFYQEPSVLPKMPGSCGDDVVGPYTLSSFQSYTMFHLMQELAAEKDSTQLWNQPVLQANEMNLPWAMMTKIKSDRMLNFIQKKLISTITTAISTDQLASLVNKKTKKTQQDEQLAQKFITYFIEAYYEVTPLIPLMTLRELLQLGSLSSTSNVCQEFIPQHFDAQAFHLPALAQTVLEQFCVTEEKLQEYKTLNLSRADLLRGIKEQEQQYLEQVIEQLGNIHLQ